jgi:hypothetical protein
MGRFTAIAGEATAVPSLFEEKKTKGLAKSAEEAA